jgi:small-conductance mechanosensitive channel
MLTYRRAFRVGDRVQIGDIVGDMAEIRLQVTHKDHQEQEITVPNSMILGSSVINCSSMLGKDSFSTPR